MNPLIYIVVRNYNSFNYLFTCIDSLLRIKYENFKIVIVDDGSKDDSTNKLLKYFSSIEVVKLKKHSEYCISLNAGIRHAMNNHAELIFIVNNDTRNFSSNLFSEIVNQFKSNPSLGMVGSLVNDFEGNLIFDGNIRNKIGIPINTPTEGYMLNVKALKKVGLFDEKLIRYFEDLDLIIRLREAGFETISVKNSGFDHLCGGTSGKQKYVPNYFRVRNLWWFLKKYKKNARFKDKLYWIYEYYEIHLKRLLVSIIKLNIYNFIIISFAIIKGTINGIFKKY